MALDNGNVKKCGFSLQKLIKIYSICLSVLIVITGVCFIAAVLHLYITGGDTPYSRERVGTYLKTIIVPIILTVLGVIGAAFLSFIDDAREKLRGNNADPVMAKRALARIFDAKNSADVLAERKKQKNILIITALASAFLIISSLILSILIPEHAIEGLNGHVVLAVLIMTPATVIVIAGIYAALRLYAISSEAEFDLMKGQIKADPTKKKSQKEHEILTRGRLIGIRCGVLVLGVFFVVLGITNGGMKDVFAKAVAICTECIGLG